MSVPDAVREFCFDPFSALQQGQVMVVKRPTQDLKLDVTFVTCCTHCRESEKETERERDRDTIIEKNTQKTTPW